LQLRFIASASGGALESGLTYEYDFVTVRPKAKPHSIAMEIRLQAAGI
jgi:hypothetical protein